jgi:hypothetical protein
LTVGSFPFTVRPMEQLLSEIETFIAAHKMRPTRFGQLAVNDPHLVKDLKGGREVMSRTAQRIRDFMLTYMADAA